MTPAERPNAEAKTRRDANFTKRGKKTTDAPSAVEAPAAATRAMAMPTLLLSTPVMVYRNFCCSDFDNEVSENWTNEWPKRIDHKIPKTRAVRVTWVEVTWTVLPAGQSSGTGRRLSAESVLEECPFALVLIHFSSYWETVLTMPPVSKRETHPESTTQISQETFPHSWTDVRYKDPVPCRVLFRPYHNY